MYESLLSIRSHILFRISSGLRCPLFSALFAVAHEIQIFTDSSISLYIGVAPHFDFCIKGPESSEQNHVFSIPPLFSKPFGSVVNCCVPAATGPIDFRPSKLLVHWSELLLYSKTLMTPDPLRLLYPYYSIKLPFVKGVLKNFPKNFFRRTVTSGELYEKVRKIIRKTTGYRPEKIPPGDSLNALCGAFSEKYRRRQGRRQRIPSKETETVSRSRSRMSSR